MSIIVVSDVHLGDENSNYTDFSNFIDWIALLEKEGNKSFKEIKLTPPEKIILLGDIIELWSPKNNDMKFPVQQAFESFQKLAGLKCEKIFVVGNHDEKISRYLDVKNKLKNDKQTKENVFKINSDFLVINRHFPEDPEKSFLQIGKDKYFFIHGQQFDKTFRRLGALSHLPTYIIECIPSNWLSIITIFIVAIYAYFSSKIIFGFFILIFVVSILLKCFDLNKLYSSIEGFFNVNDKPKYKDIQTIINEEYYVFGKDTTGMDVNLIFGHTHMPEIYQHKFKANGKEYEMLFVNSGSWVNEEKYINNTFIYIDETGPYLFRWANNANLELIPVKK